MLSLGGGRGKGIRSTPRKAILQPSEERNFLQDSPRRQLLQSYEQPHFSHYYDQPNFDQAAQEANFLQPSQHTYTSNPSPSVGRGRDIRSSPRKTSSHASRQPNFSSQDQQFWQPSPQIYQPMWSLSRGRGRGIRTSPHKAFSQPSQHAYGMQHAQQPYFSQPPYNPYTMTMDRAKWTSPFVKSFLEACAEEIEENGRPVNGFNKQAWARIVNAVMGKTGRKFTKKQLKDKHDRLKEEWRAWILVAEDKQQTGLGRNPEMGAITGPDHWWDAMIAGGMDPASGSYFSNNENTGANNLFGIFGDGTNYDYGDLYNNVNHVHATNSSNAILEIWSGAGGGAPLWSTSNAGLFCNEETGCGSHYGGTGHRSSSNQCNGFQNEGTEDGGEYDACEMEEEDPMETDESLLLEDEDDVHEYVAHAVYQKDVQYLDMLKNHALQYVPVEIVRIPYHTSTHNGFDWVMSVLTCPNPRRCSENFSMTSEVFVKLCEELVYKYGFHTIRKHAIGIFESLAMFLCILRGCSLKLVGELLNRGQATCSRQINKVLLCVTRMAKEEIQPRK